MTTLKRAMLVLGLLAGMSESAAGIDVRDPRALMVISEYGEIRNAVLDVRKLSEVRQIILVDALRDMLEENRKLRLDAYEFRSGEPDLRVVGGRAEWFIDQIVLLPREAENSQRKINDRIELWKANTVSRRRLTPQQIDMLRTKYAGKIHTGIVGGKPKESIQNLENFLDEWFPYGKPLQEMEGILGVKLPVRDSEAMLRIDSGLGGQEYRFVHDQGTIRVVKRIDLN